MSQLLITPRRTSFLYNSLKLDGITELLQIVNKEPRYFSQLFSTCRIKYKKSFLKYLKYCVDQEFMTKTKVSKSGAHERYHARMAIGRFYIYYHISDKGRTFLEMVQ